MSINDFPPLKNHNGSKRPRVEISSPSSPIAYDKFFVIKLETGTFKTISPFLIFKSLENYFGKLKDTKKLSDGSLLIEVSNEQQSTRASKYTKLDTYNVQTYPHPTLNILKGVITCKDMIHCSDQEILEHLQDQGVVHLRRIPNRKNGKDLPSSTFVLSFKTHTLPSRIHLAWYTVRVRQHIPAPLRCYSCQEFNHSSNKCTNSPLCPSCGHPPHEDIPCSTPSSCPNCTESHSPRYRGCREYKKQFEIQKIKTTEKISHFDAIKKYNTLYPTIAKSYSNSLTNNKPQFSNASTQCDFTDSAPLTKLPKTSTPSTITLTTPKPAPSSLPPLSIPPPPSTLQTPLILLAPLSLYHPNPP